MHVLISEFNRKTTTTIIQHTEPLHHVWETDNIYMLPH